MEALLVPLGQTALFDALTAQLAIGLDSTNDVPTLTPDVFDQTG